MASRYRRVAPEFWTGSTGRQIRAMGRDVQVVALYLMTCGSSNDLGLYYLALPTLAHETGVNLQGATKALRRLSEAGFCSYDEESESVFVHEMARFQLDERIEVRDNRHRWIVREAAKLQKYPQFGAWLARYGGPFNFSMEAPWKPLGSPCQAEIASPSPSPSPSPSHIPTDTGEFEHWWKLYPKHDEKKAALAQWQRLRPTAWQAAVLMAAVTVAAQSDDWRKEGGKYVPAAHRWLRGERWADELHVHLPAAAGLPGALWEAGETRGGNGFLSERAVTPGDRTMQAARRVAERMRARGEL